jgi:hypothetical protein
MVTTPLHLDPAPLEAEDLVATQAREEQESRGAAVAGWVEAGDEGADLLL